MLGFVRSWGEKNCSSVGGRKAGACTSGVTTGQRHVAGRFSTLPAAAGWRACGAREVRIPLQTRSCVLTWVPSSMVCRVKSISGTGFFCWTARMALSMYDCWSTSCWLFSMLGKRCWAVYSGAVGVEECGGRVAEAVIDSGAKRARPEVATGVRLDWPRLVAGEC